jgi:hypothetical protein
LTISCAKNKEWRGRGMFLIQKRHLILLYSFRCYYYSECLWWFKKMKFV